MEELITPMDFPLNSGSHAADLIDGVLDATDLFCGAGGSSLGAEAVPGVRLKMAANHWARAVEVHQRHFPDAGHDLADISQADPRRYPRTRLLMASPECTNHSQARGVSRRRQDPTLWDAPDPSAERSRATMWDVVRFSEQLRYDVVIVENVVEAAKWVGWRAWHVAMEDLGYSHRVISTNSMYHGVPQSRDRIFVVFWRRGISIDLDLTSMAWCRRCEALQLVRQSWKNGRVVGRYRQQWVWLCGSCGTFAEPDTRPASDIIDWTLACPRIGDRRRPLAPATRARILAGLERYGWMPITTAGAGNGHERTPGNRARPLTEPIAAQTTTATHALATPSGGEFLLNTAHGGRLHGLDRPHPTVCASDDRLSFIVPMRRNGWAHEVSEPVPTVTAGGMHHGLLMRHNSGGAEMVTPTREPVRTVTTAGHQSLLLPYYRTGTAQRVDEPAPTVTTRDRCGLVDLASLDREAIVDDCGFRMLEPHEIATAMAFPDGYIPDSYSKRDRIKLAGNAVTPPVMRWIVERVADALRQAA